MSTIPERFISSEQKVKIIGDNYCGNCILTRRTSLKRIYTPTEELGADIWSSRELFGLSVNICLCNRDEISEIDSHEDDVNIILVDNSKDEDFDSDEQVEKIELEKVLVKQLDTLIICMLIGEISPLKGTYPFKKGSPDEVIYNYEIKVLYKPTVLNVFHFQVEVFSNENGSWEVINRSSGTKKYIRTLATRIRAKILDEKKIFPLIMS